MSWREGQKVPVHIGRLEVRSSPCKVTGGLPTNIDPAGVDDKEYGLRPERNALTTMAATEG